MLPIQPQNVAIGLLTENTAQMLSQAIRLVRSLRWFGGSMADCRVVVCGVGPLASSAQRTLESLGAGIRTVARFHPGSPTGNRHHLLEAMMDLEEEIFLLLDCDIVVARDPLPYLRADAFQAKLASTETVSDGVFERVFAHFGLPKPPRSRVAPWSGTATIPYYNAGVLVLPKDVARTLAPAWRKYNLILADDPQLVAPCHRHLHQASLSLAIAETAVPLGDLPEEMNYQLNATHATAPEGFGELDPVLIHYHELATQDGFLLPTPYPRAQAAIDRFHARMEAEGFRRAARPAERSSSRPLVVLGMHRSGTSVVAQIVAALGAYAGEPDDLQPGDLFNPTGFWELKNVVRFNDEVLAAVGATAFDVTSADLSRLGKQERSTYVDRARQLVATLGEGRGPFVMKDPRMSLLVPLWREVLGNPICIIAWRHPLAVARSLATRDGNPLLASLGAWEQYTRTLLRDTEGLQRVLVSYQQLVDDPVTVVRNLHDALAGFGVEGLRLPDDSAIFQIVKPDFNRSGRSVEDDEVLLDPSQRELLDDLRRGAVLGKRVAGTPSRTLELLSLYSEVKSQRAELRRRDEMLLHREQLLDEIFRSRSWKVGHALTGVVRRLRGDASASAMKRWREAERRS